MKTEGMREGGRERTNQGVLPAGLCGYYTRPGLAAPPFLAAVLLVPDSDQADGAISDPLFLPPSPSPDHFRSC